MAGATTNISIRMDSDLKAQADALFGELGMNLSTAFNIFVRQALRDGGIPFEISLNQPNKETIAAMLEAERIAKDPSVKGYTDLDELFADLKAYAKDKIVLLISHRLYHFPEMKEILFLEDGTVTAGTHEALLSSNAAYRNLYEGQTGGEDHA